MKQRIDDMASTLSGNHTEQKHTPGPWVAGEPDWCGDYTIESDKAPWAIAAVISNFRTPAVVEANARLIAAVPDLLEALRLLLADVQDYEPWQRPCRAVDIARAALAAASGTPQDKAEDK